MSGQHEWLDGNLDRWMDGHLETPLSSSAPDRHNNHQLLPGQRDTRSPYLPTTNATTMRAT